MNEKTVIHHVRRNFHPGFGQNVGVDLLEDARRLRLEHPDLAASAVLVRWGGLEPTSTLRVVHHPPGSEAPFALVAGRHSRSDLGRIPGASLRHALILLWPPHDDDGVPEAEVLDLGTKTGLVLPDGRHAARLAGSEPLRLGIAVADVVILHARANEPLAGDPAVLAQRLSAVPAAAEVAELAEKPLTRYLDISGPRDPDETAYEHEDAGYESVGDQKSCVMVPVDFGRDPSFDASHAMLTQVISLGEGRLRPRVEVREQDLERGVRLGRYSRCRGASVLGRERKVSRVHALVLERAGRRWLFDTASTNGTRVVDVDTGDESGPLRGERTFVLGEGQAPSLAGQLALIDVRMPALPS